MFLQLQHSLEAQIAALVRNLQVLQQNHDRQQEIQDKEKAESKLQQQIEERLKRLEDLQTKMLEAQVCKFISHLPLERGRVWWGLLSPWIDSEVRHCLRRKCSTEKILSRT